MGVLLFGIFIGAHEFWKLPRATMVCPVEPGAHLSKRETGARHSNAATVVTETSSLSCFCLQNSDSQRNVCGI